MSRFGYTSLGFGSGASAAAAGFPNIYSGHFDGVDDYGSVGDVGADIYTAAFWFKPDSPITAASAWSYPLSLNGWNGMSFGDITGHIPSEIVVVYVGGVRSAYSGAGSISADWHHIAMTHNGTGYDIYLDGVDVTTVTATQAVITGSSVNIAVVSTGYFPGLIDEVALWDTAALSAAEIVAIYNSPDGPTDLTENAGDYTSSADLVNYWRMGDDNGGSGTTVTDQGSGGDDMTLQNGAAMVADAP